MGDGVSAWWREMNGWFADHGVEIAIACLVGAGLVIALLALRRLGVALCRREDATGWRAIVGRVIARTRAYFLVMLAARLVSAYANPPATIANTIEFLFVVAAVFQAAHWARELILGLIERRAGIEAPGGEAIHNAMGIIRLLVTVILFAIALIVVLDNLGVNVTGLVAGLGVGGIAIGLAAQGIFSDLFAALAILFDRPFRRGDTIRFGDTAGTVEEIGLKSTRIRAVTGEEVIVGNAELLKKELRNLARLERRRIISIFKIDNTTAPDSLERLPAMLSEIVASVEPCVPVRAGLRGIAPASLEVELQYDVRSESYDEVFAAQHAVTLAIAKRFADEGIALASV